MAHLAGVTRPRMVLAGAGILTPLVGHHGVRHIGDQTGFTADRVSTVAPRSRLIGSGGLGAERLTILTCSRYSPEGVIRDRWGLL
jgi:hypothetical protein